MKPMPGLFRVAAAFVCLLTAFAHADVKVVSKLSIAGDKNAAEPRTVTIYYQGDMIRVERADSTSIINTKTRQTLLLDDKTKTYYEFSPGQWLDVPPELGRLVKVQANAFVKATPDRKTLLDRPAERSVLDMNFTLTLASMPGFRQRMHLRMEPWTTLQFPEGAPSIGMVGVLHSILGGIESMEQVQPALASVLALKGLPLSYTATLTTTFVVPPSVGAAPRESSMEVRLVSEVESVSEEALDPTLFLVPEGYKNVTPTPEGIGAQAGDGRIQRPLSVGMP